MKRINLLLERQPDDLDGHRLRFFHPMLWFGSDFFGFMRLLIGNRFAIAPHRIRSVVFYTLVTPFQTLLRLIQEILLGSRLKKVRIEQDPVFIIGHFRSGTTMLHELLSLDDGLCFPTAYECYMPNHFLLTERFANRWLRWLLPPMRPQDMMEMRWDLPAEDEFALCNLGMPSPYTNIAFPNHEPQDLRYRDLADLSRKELQRWCDSFVRFLKWITYTRGRRIVLKSPFHTCRIAVLSKLFPNARYVHLVRDPYAVYPSTLHMWNSIYEAHGLQDPDGSHQAEYVFDSFELIHRRFVEERHRIQPQNLYELRYEDLVKDPIHHLRGIYKQLELGDPERLVQKWESFLDEHRDYRTNRYRDLEPELRSEIERRWRPYFETYGYEIIGDRAGDSGPVLD